MLTVHPNHNISQAPLFPYKMNSNMPPVEQDETKKVRLPSISTIASSLPPLTKPVSPTSLDRNSQVNKLKAVAEIFSNSQRMDVSPKSSPLQHHQHQLQQQPPQTQIIQQLPPQLPQHYSPTSTPIQPPQSKFYSPVYPQPPVPAYTTLPPNQYAVPPLHAPYQHLAMVPQPFFGHYTANAMPQPIKARAPRRQSKNQERKIKPNLVCQRCGITDTPEWRKGPNGARTLCNACGLFHAKILKKEGPEAAANAISGGKIRKKAVQRKSYSAISDQVLQQFPNVVPLPTSNSNFPQYQPQQQSPQQQTQIPLQSMYYVQHNNATHHMPLMTGPVTSPMNYPPILMMPGVKSPVSKNNE